jgi:EAL domain-containing protein (putative c-di-GMP-specific phosphodiesterase class I)
MYRAKQQGKGRVALYDPSMAERAWQRLELESELRRALDVGELRLLYQPIVDFRTGRIAAMEALVRWAHPARGLVAPDAFIPLAEESGLVVPLGRWVLREACRQAAGWVTRSSDPGPAVSVNHSPRQFLAPAHLEDVAEALRETRLSPSRLELEVTEATAMENALESIETMRALRALGVRLAVDDFGVGYAGLGYLRQCPVDGVKVDRSFVAGYDHDKLDRATVRSVLAFAEAVGLEVTAEGIETEEQWAQMRQLGCHRGQGFWFAPPLPAEELPELLATGQLRVPARVG